MARLRFRVNNPLMSFDGERYGSIWLESEELVTSAVHLFAPQERASVIDHRIDSPRYPLGLSFARVWSNECLQKRTQAQLS